jgi:FeS assembly SUF system regulator
MLSIDAIAPARVCLGARPPCQQLLNLVQSKCTKSVLFDSASQNSDLEELTMIRLGKLTDYGLLVMSQIARSPRSELHTARDLALKCRLPLPTVSKLLKILLQSGLLASHRGIKGGYNLVREPNLISVAEIVSALEGPLALTECSTDVAGLCDLEPSCPIRDNQRIINQVIRGALQKVTLSDLIRPMRLATVQAGHTNLVQVSLAPGRMQ